VRTRPLLHDRIQGEILERDSHHWRRLWRRLRGLCGGSVHSASAHDTRPLHWKRSRYAPAPRASA
jgi:hypothetical protein